MTRLTVEDIETMLVEIEKYSFDAERAHTLEDEMRDTVLEAIASSNCVDPNFCAQAALKSNDIEFQRWYA